MSGGKDSALKEFVTDVIKQKISIPAREQNPDMVIADKIFNYILHECPCGINRNIRTGSGSSKKIIRGPAIVVARTLRYYFLFQAIGLLTKWIDEGI